MSCLLRQGFEPIMPQIYIPEPRRECLLLGYLRAHNSMEKSRQKLKKTPYFQVPQSQPRSENLTPQGTLDQQLAYMKAQNHLTRGQLLANPTTLEQICNVIPLIHDKNQNTPACFDLLPFTPMQKRESHQLLLWLQEKLSFLKEGRQLTTLEYLEYRQSTVNIVLASLMEMVGTACKQLSETLGCLWSQTFGMMQAIMDGLSRKLVQKDRLIVQQEIQLQKHKLDYVDKIKEIQEGYSKVIVDVKTQFRDCVIKNREQAKEAARLRQYLRGEQIKLASVEEALVRSIDINIKYSHNEDLKWSRAVLLSLFKRRVPRLRKRQSKMLKYQEYAEFKVEDTIARYLQQKRAYQEYSIEEIISDCLRGHRVDLGSMGMPGLYLTALEVDDKTRRIYDFSPQNISRKPLKLIFQVCQTQNVGTSTHECAFLEQKGIQTFPMTNLLCQQTQTTIHKVCEMQIQTQQFYSPKAPAVRRNTSNIREVEEQARFKLVAPRKSVFNTKISFTRTPDTSGRDINQYNSIQELLKQSALTTPYSPTIREQSGQVDEPISGVGRYQSPQLHKTKLRRETVKERIGRSSESSRVSQTTLKVVRASRVANIVKKQSLDPQKFKQRIDLTSKNFDDMDYYVDQEATPAIFRSRQVNLKKSYALTPEPQLNTQPICIHVSNFQEIKTETEIEIADPYQMELGSDPKFDPFEQNTHHPFSNNQGIFDRLIASEPKIKPHTDQLQRNIKLWSGCLRSVQKQPVPLRNVSQKLVSLSQMFIVLISEVVKTRVFSNRFINPQLSRRYFSSNLSPKYVYKPLPPLYQIVIDKLTSQSKRKLQTQKSLRGLLNELIVLSQTKQMEVFVSLMGLNNQMMGSTELEILVRMMYFLCPSKPYGFSADLKIMCLNVKKYLAAITDGLLDKDQTSRITKGLLQDDIQVTMAQVFKQICACLKVLKTETYQKYKYVGSIFEFVTLQDLTLLLNSSNRYRCLLPDVSKKFSKFSDCLTGDHQKSLTYQKVWRLGLQCKLPSEQQLLSSYFSIKIPSRCFTNTLCRFLKDRLPMSRKVNSLFTMQQALRKSGFERWQYAQGVIVMGTYLEQVLQDHLGQHLAVLSSLLLLI